MAVGLIEETFEGTPGIEERDATQLAGLTEHADESQVPWHLLALDGDEVFVGQPAPWLRRVEEGGGVSEGADALDRHAGRLHQAGHRIAVLVLLFEGAERVPHGGLVLDHDDPGVEGGQGRGQGIAQDGIPHFDAGRPSLELLRPLQPELQECGEGQLRRRLSACFRQSGVHQAGPQADPNHAGRPQQRSVRICGIFGPDGKSDDATLPDFTDALGHPLEPSEGDGRWGHRLGHVVIVANRAPATVESRALGR